MKKKKMLFVYNPRAGKGQIRTKLSDIIEIFVQGGYEVTTYATGKQGDAIEIVADREKGRYDVVACCGGDGTLNEVVTGMMSCEEILPIGYIPAGSTNDYAQSVGIPSSMKKAAQAIVDGNCAAYDVGLFNENRFVYIAAFGLFTEVSYGTDQNMKNLLGHTAYILEGAKSLSAVKSYRVKVETGQEVIEEKVIFGMITNTNSVGGYKKLTDHTVKLDDGEFEVTLIRMPQNPVELNNIIVSLVSGKLNAECICCMKASHIRIETQEPISWTLDGEYGGEHREVNISNESKKLLLLGTNK
ncbi:MAG: diacylglycerol kinase family lipid kinase [Lachnospiraceae bacterium]|nr:diacylglycerol kinase family lipid kinase [Lachnospiraceae bacterium]